MTKSSTAAKIPRPMNCFMTFRVEKQREILSQCPGANHRDISKIVAKWWRDIPDDKKEPYRVKAAIAKVKHLEQYPNYKYRPQKKTLKTRPYKKRPENEFTARDYQNKHQLFSLYHDGKVADIDNTECLLDVQPKKVDNEQQLKMEPAVEQQPVVVEQQKEEIYLAYPSSGDTDIYQTANLLSAPSYNGLDYSTGLLYPPVNDMMYTTGSTVPSAYSASSSPYSVGYYYPENEVNYQQVFGENYGFVQPVTPSYSVPSHINLFDNQFYELNQQHQFLYTTTIDSSECLAQPTNMTAPSLLTAPFYYQ